MLVIGFMLTIQRCHDFDMSGWLSLLVLVPLVNLMFWFIPGTDGPNRYGLPTPPNSAGVIVAACAVPLLVFFGGILAAIAIPAYQDYTHRARVSEVIVSASPWRVAVAEHYMANSKWPASAAELNPAPAATSKYGRIDLGADGVLTLTMVGSQAIADQTIELRPKVAAGAISWDCSGGTLPPKYRPASCRAR
jgi:type IV pilus assembly protein PilA